MAAKDVTVIGPCRPSELDALLTAAGVESDWGFAICQYGNGLVLAVIIEAA